MRDVMLIIYLTELKIIFAGGRCAMIGRLEEGGELAIGFGHSLKVVKCVERVLGVKCQMEQTPPASSENLVRTHPHQLIRARLGIYAAAILAGVAIAPTGKRQLPPAPIPP
jgi:hypothetical protein